MRNGRSGAAENTGNPIKKARGGESVEGLIEENRKLKKEKLELERSLEEVLNSKSWRITEFFRRLSSRGRMLFPLFRWRKHELFLEPGRNVVETDGRFSVVGISPTIFIRAKSGQLPSGWVRFSARFRSERSPLFFLLYFGRNGDYNPHNRVWLNLPANGLDSDLGSAIIRIPEWATELRLDPFDSELEFSSDGIKIDEIGKIQVASGIVNKHLRGAVKQPEIFLKKLKKLFAIFKEGGLTAIKLKLFADNYTSNYQEWVRKYDTITDSDREKIRTHIESFRLKPLVSVLMPVYNTPERWLRAAIDSVRRQLYTNWELCIADDGSTEPHVRKVLEEYRALDTRIKVEFRKQNGHISAASNTALEIASGEYAALLDHDDELSEHAIYMVVERLNKNPDAKLIYSDEDKLSTFGMRFNPYFKTDFNLSLLLQQNFICHLAVCDTKVLREIGGFRPGYEGAQDWDLFLRIFEEVGSDKIHHIPHVLYHWRVIEGSTAQATAFKPYVMDAQAKAVREHLKRTKHADFTVSIREDVSQLRVEFTIPAEPKVTLIIPTRDQLKYLRRCIDSIVNKTKYENFELIVIDNGSRENSTHEYFRKIAERPNIKIISDDAPFNFSELNNKAARASSGEVIGFLNNDLEVVTRNWLDEMVSQLQQRGVGATGAKLYYPNDLLQHAGVVLGIGGVAGHSHKGRLRGDVGYFNRIILNQDVSAVTAACMLVRRSVFEEVGGFDSESLAVAFNDVDLCLKIRKAGYRIVYCAYAELYHFESISRGFENTPSKFQRFEKEIEVMKKRWKEILSCDPYYNPNLTLLTEDYTFSYPPRARYPWQKH